MIRFLGDASALNTTLGRVDSKLSGLGKLATRGGIAIGVAAATGVTASVAAFASFDEKMNQSLAIMGDVTDMQKGEMNEAAREIGKTTRLSASEAAESYFFLASAGLDVEQQMLALPQVAAFAQAGMFDMATATDLATDAQSALGLSIDDPVENLANLTRVTDVLVGANTLANASVEQFASALTNDAAASLKLVNKDMEEGVAVLAVWADQGLKGEAAGTSLGIVMRDLKTKAVENEGAFAAAGVAVFDSNGEMNNMADIVGDLENAFGDLDPEAQAKAMMDLGFSQRNIKKMAQLMGSSEDIRKYEKELRKMGGTTQEVADKQLESFSAQMDLMKGKLEDVAITIGGKVAPLILKAMNKISGWWDENGPAIEQGIKTSLGRLSEWWTQNGPMIREGLETLFQTIGKVFQFLLDWWNTNGPTVLEVIGNVVDFIIETFHKIVGWFEKNWPQILEIVMDVIETVQAAWERFGPPIIEVLKIFIDKIGAVFESILDIIQGVIKIIKGIFQGDWQEIWDGVKLAVSGVVTGIINIIKGLVPMILAALDPFADLLIELVINPIADGIDWLTDKVAVVIDFFSDLLIAIGDLAVDAVATMIDFGASMVRGLLEGLGAAGGAVASFAQAIGRAIRSMINNHVIKPINDLLEFEVSMGPLGSFTVNAPDIPDIPSFARGGVTGVNSPFLAMVGDNKTSREIITPEALMRDIVSQESGGGGGDITINMQGQVSPREVADEIQWAWKNGAAA
tara:strand:- start:1017 stop:3245 length:2229 start_codon:yes stop_codon:yes gene_type:complete